MSDIGYHDYKNYVQEGSKKIVSCYFQKTMQCCWFFYEKTGEQGSSQKDVASGKQKSEYPCLKNMMAGSHPEKYPSYYVNVY